MKTCPFISMHLKKKKKMLPIHLFLGLNMFLVCKFWGQNDLILLFGKIYCNLPLFLKYIRIYHYLKTQVPQTRVCYKTQVLLKFATMAMAELKLFFFKCHLELKLVELEFFVDITQAHKSRVS